MDNSYGNTNIHKSKNKNCFRDRPFTSKVENEAAFRSPMVVAPSPADSSQGLGMTGWQCREPMVGMAALCHIMSF
ncbi:MAG: hypothetical protein ACI4TM_06425 [Candidatus Cryptobacteroides sp.]